MIGSGEQRKISTPGHSNKCQAGFSACQTKINHDVYANPEYIKGFPFYTKHFLKFNTAVDSLWQMPSFLGNPKVE